MHALDHLTEDCWKEILKRVKDPKDLWSCSEACLTFQEILRENRNQFMFALVLPIIKKYPSALYPYFDDELAQWKALLKCRLVCKSWCDSIDKRRDAEGEHVFQDLYQFESGEETDRFLQKFSTHAGNPFLGRSVTLHHRSPLLLAGNEAEVLNKYGEEEAFHIRKLRQLLERFGTEIWNLKLEDSQFEDDLDDNNLSLWKNVQTVLGHLPNLRTFTFMGDIADADDEELEGRNMADHELAPYLAANPFPDLPQLEDIQLCWVIPAMVRFILVKYAPSLKSLVVDDPIGFPEQGLQMLNLMKLELSFLDLSTSLRCFRQLQAPQLRDLELGLSGNRNNVEVWPLDELFRNIQHLPIRRLMIILDESEVFLGESGAIAPDQRAYHGSISSIYLWFHGGTASLNFLLYCPQLTCVFLKCESPQGGFPSGHPKGVPELLDVGDLLGQDGSDFYESNIWEHVPHLEHLSIGDVKASIGSGGWKWNDYDRIEYEKRQLGD